MVSNSFIISQYVKKKLEHYSFICFSYKLNPLANTLMKIDTFYFMT